MNDYQGFAGHEAGPDGSTPSPFQKYKTLIIVGVVAAVVLVFGLSIWGWLNGIDNEANTRQRSLITLYQGVETKLSTCLDNSMQAAGIAKQERDSLKDMMIGTALARSKNGSSSEGAVLNINAVNEALPQNVSNDLYKQLMTTVTGCRNEVAGAQQNLQAYGGEFDIWTQTGGVFEKMVRGKYPNEKLKAVNADGDTLTGRDALDFIVTPISTTDAKDAVTSKEMPSQQLFPSSSPTSS